MPEVLGYAIFDRFVLEIVQNGAGSSKDHAIALPERVNPSALTLILDYCRYHQLPATQIRSLLRLTPLSSLCLVLVLSLY
jgi:hypothetical protein